MTSHFRTELPEAETFEPLGAIFRRMASRAGINPTFRRALREAFDLHDVAEAFIDGEAQDHVEGRR